MMECPSCNQVTTSAEACELCGWRAEVPKPDETWRGVMTGAVAAVQSAAQSVLNAAGAGASPDGDSIAPDEAAVAAAPVAEPDGGTEAEEPAPEEDASPGAADPPQPGPTITNVDLGGEAETESVNVVNGNHTVFNRTTNVFQGAVSENVRLRSLLEITTEFRLDERPAAVFDAGEIAAHAHLLAEDGLLLVGCLDPSLARTAANALVASLSLQPERARLLGFREQAALTITTLVRSPNKDGGETVVVADGLSAGAQTFLDSLLNGHGAFSVSEVKQELRKHRLMLLCVAEPERISTAEPARGDESFARWVVPFLELFLRREFPREHEELRVMLDQQRESGRWSRDDAAFCNQLRTFAAQGRLREVIESGGAPPGETVTVDEEQPVHQAVLFAASFFTGLAPADFSRLVTLLLGDATIALPLPSPPAADGAPPPPVVHRIRPLAEVWRENPERILRDCRLAVLKDPAASRRTVEFTEPGARERLCERLEREYPFFLERIITVVHDHGLLFADSEALAASVVALTAEMVESYPETYDRDWVATVVVSGRAARSQAPRLVGLRGADLLRGLWARPAAQPVVEGVLDRLLGAREFDTVLDLVRRLRFAPGFDQLRWLRQLIDRGNEDARTSAYRFLYREVVAVGTRVYPTLHALAEWLPAEDRDVRSYSPSNRLALQLMVEYAADSAARFDPEAYGEWPVRYPLLAADADADRTRDLPLLVRWLLHPGIPRGVREGVLLSGVPRLVAALVAEWTFILFGPRGAPADAESAGAGDDAERVFTLLLSEIAARTATPPGRVIRAEMLEYWDEMRMRLVPTPEMTRVERAELAWKRGLFRALLLRFRALARAFAAPAGDTRPL